MMTAEEIIEALNLEPHPEGGYYRETFRDPAIIDERSVCTAIYFLLEKGKVSHWHKVDATEIWLYHAGATLELMTADDETSNTIKSTYLGIDLKGGERPQAIVRANQWQSAKTMGDWTLVSCTVAPGFLFEKFELAEEGWYPGKDN